MPNSIQNINIVLGGTVQELVPARLGRSRLIIEPQDEDCWVSPHGNAAADVGERVASGQSASFTVYGFPEIGARWTVFSATTGADIVVRET